MSDDETWVDAEHANTLNAFDQGDVRTTHAVVEQASTLQAGGGERGNRLDAEMAAGGQLVAQAYSIREDAKADTFSATEIEAARCLQKHQPSVQSHHAQTFVAEAFSVYPEGGNGADIAASPAERSPSLTKVKSERGIHVASTAATLTSGGHPNSNAPGRRNEDDMNLVSQRMTVRRLTPVECERLMGWPDGFTAPPGVKAPDSKRYAACGDGIVAPVAFWIADRIRMIEEEGGI